MKTELTTSSDLPVLIKQYNGAIVLHHENDTITLFKPETIELRNFLNQLELGDKSLVGELVEALTTAQQHLALHVKDLSGKRAFAVSATIEQAEAAINKAKWDK